MNIVVQKEKFQKALGFVEKVTSKNTALPILSNILLKTEHGRLTIAATNLEVGVISTVGAKVQEEGSIAVPGRILSDFIRGVQAETITLISRGQNLSVEAGKFNTTILCFDAAEFPIIPKIRNTNQKQISAQLFQGMINGITDSIATSESRPELSGAFLSFQPTTVVLAATDSFRLVERKTALVSDVASSVIVPRVTMMELARILTGIEGDISIAVADNQISFSHDEFEIVSRLIDGKYPEYQKVIPERSISRVLARKGELENAVKTAALFSSSISDIKIECSDEGVSMTAKNSSKGEVQAAIEANIKGDAFDVAMNYHYFLDGLKTIDTDKVVMEFTGKGSPFVLRPNDDKKEAVYIIMPLRN